MGWAHVQAVELSGGRWFARPTLRVDDGESIKLSTLGVVFGLGRTRAERVVQRIEHEWLAHRGPWWRPLPPPMPAPEPFPPRADVNYWAPPTV